MDMLERAAERETLRAVIAGAADGRGSVAVLDGPSGVGKSTLLRWLGDAGRDCGVRLVGARATRLGGQIAFGVARRLLEAVVHERPELVRTGWARRCGPLFEGEPDGAGAPAAVVEGLVALVARATTALGPLTLTVDDAHWADAASLTFLVELAERCDEVGAGLVVAIGRDPETAEPPALGRLRALAAGRVLRPGPLSAEAVMAEVRRRLPGVDDDFAARLARASAGNPLLVSELLHAAARGGAGRFPDAGDITHLARDRLARFAPPVRALATAIALLGETPLRRAAALAELAPRDADAAADVLIAHAVVESEPPLRFAQPILADALLSTLAPFALAARHRRAAQLLAGDGAPDERVAAHLMGVRPDRDEWVCEVLRRAAGAALGHGDPEGAARLLARAAEEPPEPDVRGLLLVELAQARAAAGQPAAIETFERALAEVEDPAQRARAWHGLSRLLYVRAELPLAARVAARGAAELADDDPGRERLLADELGAASLVAGLAPGAAARTEGLLAGPPPADPALLAHLIAWGAWHGRAVARLPELARAAVATDPLVDPESGGFALSFVAGSLNMVDRTDLSVELLDAGLRRVAQRGDPLTEVSLRCCRAWARLYRGELELAAEDLDRVLALEESAWPAIDGLIGPPLVVLRLEVGDLAGAQAALARTPPGAQPGRAWFQGAIAAAEGDHDAALAAFQDAGVELEDTLGMGNPGVLPWRSSAALAAFAAGERERARRLVAPELERTAALPVPRAHGVALRAAGVVQGDLTLLARSVEVLEGSPARLALARSLVFLGAGLRHARRVRDAREPLTRGLQLADECGATVLGARALDELRAAGARPRRRPASGPASLTASERSVARHAAAGLTTRQIAAELFLTPKTVEGHLTRVFRKLRISSRTEIASRLAAVERADGRTGG